MIKSFQLKQFKLHSKGVTKILGELESEIMEIVWQQKISTVREICNHLSQIRKKALSFNTIMTIMNRLGGKGLLEKRRGENCYEYEPKLTKREFLDDVSDDVIKDLMKNFKPYVLAHFAENLDKDDLEELIKLREEYLRES